MADSLTAAQKQIQYAVNELRSGDTEKAQGHLAKAAGFIERAQAEEPTAEVGETLTPLTAEWSQDRNVAIHQILAEAGHPTVLDESGASIGTDPTNVIADATPEQIEALTVLGYFGTPGVNPAIDYEPFERYYEQTSDDGQGNTGWGPKADYPTGDAVWAAYLSTKGS